MASALEEFPILRLHFSIPPWVQTLPEDHWLVEHIIGGVRAKVDGLCRVRDYAQVLDAFAESPYTEGLSLESISLGEGAVCFSLPLNDGLFYQILGEQCGTQVRGEAHLMSLMADLVEAKREYDRVAEALDSVRQTGYGLVAPKQDELTLEEPQIVKQGNRFGVRLKASAPSLHMIRVDIQTDVSTYKMLNMEIVFPRKKGNAYSKRYDCLFDVDIYLLAG